MKKIETKKVKEFYEAVDSVWQQDRWYAYSKETIEKFIAKQQIKKTDFILNAGSGGNDYNLANKMEHLDLAENKIKQFKHYTVGSIEKTNYQNSTFDVVICVGSVLNYTDALTTVSEISRVIKKQGKLILEFESSWGFEHIKTEAYKKDAEILELKYYESKQAQWVYSPVYVAKLLQSNGFKIINREGFHILGALHFRFSQNEDQAAKFDKFDNLFSKLPYFKKHADNVLMVASKL
ncbi:methyltransferase domain-containing protein [Enterococcus sp. LJL90]